MTHLLLIRAGALYVPLVFALMAWMLRPPSRRLAAGILLGCIWNSSALLAVNLFAMHYSWWNFGTVLGTVCGMPVEMYLGWITLWGALPQLLFPRSALWVRVVIFAAVDLAAMRYLDPVLVLNAGWLLGEGAALALAFLPGQILSDLTAEGRHLYVRATMQLFCFSALIAFLLPALIYWNAGHKLWPSEVTHHLLALQLVAVPGLMGVAALQEFATVGAGTPLPYDPPLRMVRSGPYAYVANPMQLSTMLLLMMFAVIMRNAWFVFAAVVSHSYSAGLAQFDEQDDLPRRFGESYQEYRNQMLNWLPKWRPHPDVLPAAQLYVSYGCDMCSQLGVWIASKSPINLQLQDAAEHSPALQRLTYSSQELEFEGVAAVARALQHLNLGYAYLGWLMLLPGMRQLLQVLVDASGGEARNEPLSCETRSAKAIQTGSNHAR